MFPPPNRPQNDEGPWLPMYLSATRSITGRGRNPKALARWTAVSLLVLAAAAWLVWMELSAARERRYDPQILESARRNGVDPCLLKALIWRESRFNPNARGRKGEFGLTQLLERGAVADWTRRTRRQILSKGACFNPALNIEIGAWYLGQAVRRWGDYAFRDALALAQYNAGPTAAKRWAPSDPAADPVGRIDFPETRRYVQAILDRRGRYQRQGFGSSAVKKGFFSL